MKTIKAIKLTDFVYVALAKVNTPRYLDQRDGLKNFILALKGTAPKCWCWATRGQTDPIYADGGVYLTLDGDDGAQRYFVSAKKLDRLLQLCKYHRLAKEFMSALHAMPEEVV